MRTKQTAFKNTYGPWALIAGASEGIGRAFSRALASRGFNLVLIARTKAKLETLAGEIASVYGVETRIIDEDLSRPDMLNSIAGTTDELDIGLLVYNAALSHPAPFLDIAPDRHEKLIETNCRGPLLLTHYFAEKFRGRTAGVRTTEGRSAVGSRRAGIILLSSMSGFQGSPYVANYAASKAYNMTLAEGLWYELKPYNIDVLTSCPGPTDTPGFRQSLEGSSPPAFPPVTPPELVAETALSNLGKRPLVVPGTVNRIAVFFMKHFFSRRKGVEITGKKTGAMYNS
jgi:hypothetical protein